MSKKITVTLDDVAEQHFHNVNYGFDIPDGKGGIKPGSQSELISCCLMELRLFEEIMGEQVISWLMVNYLEKYNALLRKWNKHIDQHPEWEIKP